MSLNVAETANLQVGSSWTKRADAILQSAAIFWFVAMTSGLWVFLSYVAIVFGPAAANGEFEQWNSRLQSAYVQGDAIGNVAVAMHLLLAVVILGGGPLQFMPQIRNRFPAFHHWLGRIYALSVITTTVTGLYMLFSRDIGTASLKFGFVTQATCIVLFSSFAVRYAVLRDIENHRRWALRFFLVANIALTYRVIFIIWVVTTGGIGVDMTNGEGPFLEFMIFGQYIPSVMLEAYFRVQNRGGTSGKFAMASLLSIGAVAIILGVAFLAIGVWFKTT